MSDLVKMLERDRDQAIEQALYFKQRVAELEAEKLATFARMRELNEYGSTRLETMAGRIARLEEALRDISHWDQELQDKVSKHAGTAISMWRGCIAVARRALQDDKP